jgi:transcription elongation factor Elf1
MKETYRCNPCNYEYEHLYFDTVPRDMQKDVPPCPICGHELVSTTQVIMDDYFYRCWESEGGCGLTAMVEYQKGLAPETRPCSSCAQTMRLGVKPGSFGIVHGEGMEKGASMDVVIGRDAAKRWEKVHDRKESRDKLRQESGTSALRATGPNQYEPMKGAKLRSVVVPANKVYMD